MHKIDCILGVVLSRVVSILPAYEFTHMLHSEAGRGCLTPPELELELQMIMSPHSDTDDRTEPPGRPAMLLTDEPSL